MKTLLRHGHVVQDKRTSLTPLTQGSQIHDLNKLINLSPRQVFILFHYQFEFETLVQDPQGLTNITRTFKNSGANPNDLFYFLVIKLGFLKKIRHQKCSILTGKIQKQVKKTLWHKYFVQNTLNSNAKKNKNLALKMVENFNCSYDPYNLCSSDKMQQIL